MVDVKSPKMTQVSKMRHRVSFTLVVLRPWSGLRYPFGEVDPPPLSVTIGDTSPWVMPEEWDVDQQENVIGPSRYTLQWAFEGCMRYMRYNELTGLGTWHGYYMLTFESKTGSLHVKPEKGIENYLTWSGGSGRKKEIFKFTIWALYDQWRAGGVETPSLQHTMLIEVFDDTCWLMAESGLKPWRLGNSEDLECRKKCASDATCASYSFVSKCLTNDLKSTTIQNMTAPSKLANVVANVVDNVVDVVDNIVDVFSNGAWSIPKPAPDVPDVAANVFHKISNCREKKKHA